MVFRWDKWCGQTKHRYPVRGSVKCKTSWIYPIQRTLDYMCHATDEKQDVILCRHNSDYGIFPDALPGVCGFVTVSAGNKIYKNISSTKCTLSLK